MRLLRFLLTSRPAGRYEQQSIEPSAFNFLSTTLFILRRVRGRGRDEPVAERCVRCLVWASVQQYPANIIIIARLLSLQIPRVFTVLVVAASTNAFTASTHIHPPVCVLMMAHYAVSCSAKSRLQLSTLPGAHGSSC